MPIRSVGLTAALVLAGALTACSREARVPAVGTIERYRYEIAATAAEQIVAMPKLEGQAVRRGELVAQLDSASLAANRASQAALVRQLKFRLDELVHGARSEEITEGRAQLAAAAAQRDQAAREYERQATLLARGLISPSQVDQQRQLRDSTAAAARSAQAALELLLKGTRSEQIEQASAALRSAQALLDQQDVLLGHLQLLAPVDGVIEALPYRLGERPTVGAPVVIMLASGTPFARVYIPEPERAALHAGQSLKVRVDGIAQPFNGTLRYIAGEASFTPYYALTQRDRSRLAFLAEIDLPEAAARDLPVGVPAEVPLDRAP
jgi:HlyD family secretion protein